MSVVRGSFTPDAGKDSGQPVAVSHGSLPAQSLPRSRPSPDDKDHPDHALLEQIRDKVRAHGQASGVSHSEAEERLSRSLLAACKDNREMYPNCSGYSLADNAFSRADHVLAGKDNMFVVQGALGDPASQRAQVNVAQAMNTPVEQSDAKLELSNQAISQQREQARQHESTRSQDQEASRGPGL